MWQLHTAYYLRRNGTRPKFVTCDDLIVWMSAKELFILFVAWNSSPTYDLTRNAVLRIHWIVSKHPVSSVFTIILYTAPHNREDWFVLMFICIRHRWTTWQINWFTPGSGARPPLHPRLRACYGLQSTGWAVENLLPLFYHSAIIILTTMQNNARTQFISVLYGNFKHHSSYSLTITIMVVPDIIVNDTSLVHPTHALCRLSGSSRWSRTLDCCPSRLVLPSSRPHFSTALARPSPSAATYEFRRVPVYNSILLLSVSTSHPLLCSAVRPLALSHVGLCRSPTPSLCRP
jgi:hypothetical protein